MKTSLSKWRAFLLHYKRQKIPIIKEIKKI